MNILTNSITNQWFEAVHQAQELACFHFKEPQVERYVVDLLNKNYKNNNINDLNSLVVEISNIQLNWMQYNACKTQQVADMCLILIGMYPDYIRNKCYDYSFLQIACQDFYSNLAKNNFYNNDNIFSMISENIDNIVLVLNHMNASGFRLIDEIYLN